MAQDQEVKNILLKSSRNLTISTFVSRLLGFLREIFTASIIGAGMEMSAWILAITLPNLFRRILGEGALGTAMIPMIVHSMKNEGDGRAKERFSTIFIWLCLLLALLSLLISVPAFFLSGFLPEGRWRIAALLTPLVMPYCIFICAVGSLTSYANSLRDYFLPSLAAILQNVVMIGALGCIFRGFTLPGRFPVLHTLSAAVILSGILEFILLLWIIRRRRMLPVLNRKTFLDFDTIRSIMRLALPGIAGASALQISLIADRTIGGLLSDHAVPALYFADRLVLLPIGVFAFAFGTVSLGEMSRIAAEKKYDEMIGTMIFSLRNLFFVTVPVAVFMLFFCEDLVRLVYMRGRFDDVALRETVYTMLFYLPGIPSFAAYKVTVSGFTARKDMLSPMYVTFFTVALNIGLNLLFMKPLAQGGLALATTITSLAGNTILLLLLARKFGAAPFGFPALFGMLARLFLACGAAGGIAFFCLRHVSPPLAVFTRPLLAGVLFGLLFILFCLVLRIREVKPFLARFLKIKLK